MSAAPPIRPDEKLGLVLGGGGARGLAAVGVLEELRARGLLPEIVVGTSMGALAGVFYCAGYSSEEIRRIAVDTGWTDVADLPTTSGLLRGQRFAQWLAERLPERLEDLDTPLICTAVDIDTGELVLLEKGSLPDAIRATCAFPGAFAPVRLKGRHLVDGGLKSTVPVHVLHGRGLDRIVACDFQAPLNRMVVPEKTDRRQAWARFWETLRLRRRSLAADILLKAVDILQSEVCRRELEADPPDLLIRPVMDHVNLEDFRLAPEIVEVGLAATRRALDGES